MTKIELISIIAEQADQVIGTLADMDDCILGVTEINSYFRVVYDGNAMVRKLIGEGMTAQEAEDEVEAIQTLFTKKFDPIFLNNLENGLRW